MTLRTRFLLGAALLLAVGLLAEWALREPLVETPGATRAPAPAPPPEAAPAAAPAEARQGLAPAPAAVTASAPAPAPAPEEDEAVRGVAQENDPIEPELPQTPEWKLEKTAHLSGLMDRHAARLEAERAEAERAGRAEEAKRLEVAAARAQRRLANLKAEMAALQAEAGAVAAQ